MKTGYISEFLRAFKEFYSQFR